MLPVTGRVRLASYDLLAAYYGLGADSELEDANHNGRANLLQYGLGNDPTNAVYRAATTQGRSNEWFQIRFTRNTDAVDLSYLSPTLRLRRRIVSCACAWQDRKRVCAAARSSADQSERDSRGRVPLFACAFDPVEFGRDDAGHGLFVERAAEEGVDARGGGSRIGDDACIRHVERWDGAHGQHPADLA